MVWLYYISFILILFYNRLEGGNPASQFLELKLINAGAAHWGWFILGIQAFRYSESKNNVYLYLAIVFASISVGLKFIFSTRELFPIASLVLVSAFFLVPLVNTTFRKILSNRVLLFLGFISYPLYLIHQNIVTGLASDLAEWMPNFPPVFYPLPGLIFVILTAYLIAKAEPYFN